MTNKLRSQIEEEEAEKQRLIVEERKTEEFPDNFLTKFFTKGFWNADIVQ